MAAVEAPLNLLTLARTGVGQAHLVPGTGHEVVALIDAARERTATPTWLLLLAGELIVDLPHGDFRLLHPGEALHLPAGLEVGFQPVEDSVLLRSRG